MTTTRMVLLFVVISAAAANLIASGPVGIYAILDKVIFEPNDNAPERIQLWGAFKYVEGGLQRPGNTSLTQRGYLYFKLPSGSQQPAAKSEWRDLKAIAGTGQAVGFGDWFYTGGFNPADVRTDARIRPASEMPANPGNYNTNAGIVKLAEAGSHADVVKQLREALKAK